MSQEPKVTRFGADPTRAQEVATKAYVDAGGGSGLTFAKVVKTVDQTINNTNTLQDDDELKFTPNINKTYWIYIFLFLTIPSASDFKSSLSLPAGATARRPSDLIRSGSQTASSVWTTAGFIAGSGTANRCLQRLGRMIMGATAGDCILQWAQNTAIVEDTSVLQGSFLIAWEEN